MRCRRGSYLLAGIICGATLGFVAGLLMAPRTGAQTRRRLAGEARRVAESARFVAEKAERVAEVLGERVDHYLGREEEVAWRKVREIRKGVERYTQTQIP
jgi:gas vesicle protein